MLVSISAPSSASGAVDYYVKGSTKNQIDSKYYLSQQGPSFWGGGAKDALNLPDGPVQAVDFINMLSGHLPNGQRLGRMIDGKLYRDMGRDLTVSLCKSGSILALSEYGKPIMDDFVQSVKEGMAFLEKELAHTRIYNKDTGKQDVIGNQKIVHATFIETLNRAGEPHIHAHNVWPNIALGEDNKIRSALMGTVYTHKILLGAVIRGYFGDKLKKRRLSLEPAGKHGLFEIKGIDRETIDAFSTRRKDILEAAKGSLKDPKRLARLTLMTRPKKTRIAASELIARQNATFEKLGVSLKSLWDKAIGMPSAEKVTPSHALSNAIINLSENKRDFARLELLKAGLISVYGNVTVDALQIEIDKQVSAGKLLISRDGQSYILPRTLRLEQSVIDEWKKGHLKGGIISPSKFKAAAQQLAHLTRGQFEAAKLITTSLDQSVAIQGDAGTGKTTLLVNALPLVQAAGLKLIGIAPTDAAVDELRKTGMFDQVMTTQKFVITPAGNSHTILIVDEASQLGTEDMLSIQRYVSTKNMPRLVLMGDTNQMPAVRQGTPFKDLQKAGIRTAVLDEIVRQKDARHREGVSQLARGNVRGALETLRKEVHEITKQDDIAKYTAQVWRGLKDPKAPVVVQTHKQKREINAAIKKSLRLHEYQPPAPTPLKVWQPVRLQVSERGLFRAYADISHLRFNRTQKGLNVKAGEVYKIIGRNEYRSSLKLSNGKKTLMFIPAKHGHGQTMTETYRQEILNINTGDRIRFTRGQRGKFKNNDYATITKISAKDINVEMDEGKTLTIPMTSNAIRHIDHGWAATAYALQGKTVPNAIAIMPSRDTPLTTLESLYTGASRHKDKLAIITDNSARLVETLEKKLQARLKDISYKNDKVSETSKSTGQENDRKMESIKAKTRLDLDAQRKKTQKNDKERFNNPEHPIQPERHRQDRSR